jgi:sec-independent protein translocase protein TatC
MTFLAHLEELRRRILWMVISVIVLTIGAYIYAEELIRFFSRPIEELVFIKPFEAFLVKIKVALFAGGLLSIPIILYQVWSFAANGLTRKEKKIILVYFPLSILLFFAGALFANQLIVPIGMQFFLSQSMAGLTAMISISAYFSFLFWMLLVFGIMFELPLVVFFLAQFGLLHPDVLKKQRRLVIVLLFVVAAFLTPPDLVSQILLAVPLWLLLEISIFIAGFVYPRK